MARRDSFTSSCGCSTSVNRDRLPARPFAVYYPLASSETVIFIPYPKGSSNRCRRSSTLLGFCPVEGRSPLDEVRKHGDYILPLATNRIDTRMWVLSTVQPLPAVDAGTIRTQGITPMASPVPARCRNYQLCAGGGKGEKLVSLAANTR